MPATAPRLISCHDCGLLLRLVDLPEGGFAKCPRCHAVLLRHRTDSIDRTFSFALAALILFVIAQAFPFLGLRMEGREQLSHLSTGAFDLYRVGMEPLGILVLLVAIVFPMIKIVLLLMVLEPIRRGRRPAYLSWAFRLVERLRPWAMMEVYLLGVFVAYVKLQDLATIEIGIGLFAFAALIVVMVAADAALEPDEVWERVLPARSLKQPMPSELGSTIACHSCDLVVAVDHFDAHGRRDCPRCGAELHHRKPDSLARTAALVAAAAILYVPANVFPVMTVISFGHGEPDTILSGVRALIAAEMWPLALLVFFASIIVPMLKLLGLTFLVISVRRRSQWRRRDRTVLYRIIEGVGRWSMIDVFMIAILTSLVQLGSIATIEPGIGAMAFASVVVITMIGSTMFDPRLIWDAPEDTDARNPG